MWARCHETLIAAGLLSLMLAADTVGIVGSRLALGNSKLAACNGAGAQTAAGTRRIGTVAGKCDMSVMCRCLVSQPGVWVAARWSLLWPLNLERLSFAVWPFTRYPYLQPGYCT